MHEASLVAALVEQVIALKEEKGAQRITSLRVRIGEFAGVEVEAFRFAYEALKEKVPELRESVLEIEIVPGRLRCRDCETLFEGDYFTPCPRCQNFNREILSGEELELRQVEMEV